MPTIQVRTLSRDKGGPHYMAGVRHGPLQRAPAGSTKAHGESGLEEAHMGPEMRVRDRRVARKLGSPREASEGHRRSMDAKNK